MVYFMGNWHTNNAHKEYGDKRGQNDVNVKMNQREFDESGKKSQHKNGKKGTLGNVKQDTKPHGSDARPYRNFQ